MNTIKNILATFIKGCTSLASLVNKSIPQHLYRILSIEQDSHDNYMTVIQIRNKKEVFRMKPEEILANDALTDSFSQRDIRTLTYLGYLGINSPKYRILAKRLAEKDTKITFAIQKRGEKDTLVKTASEISSDDSLLSGLQQTDAHLIGYTVATEQILSEQKQKQQILSSMEKSF